MQLVAVPLYNKDMVVEAYMFRDLKENNLFSSAQATNLFDGASKSEALNTLNRVGLDAFTLGKPLFIPIKEIMLLGNLQAQCGEPADKIIFVLESPLSPDEIYLQNVWRLREAGFRFAVNYPINPNQKDAYLESCSFIFLSQREENKAQSEATLAAIKRYYRNLVPIATHIYSNEAQKKLYGKGYELYESRFYKVPVTLGEHAVSPLKANAIRLINTVQDDNFDFEDVAAIVRGDTALTISLLRMVNALSTGFRSKIKTIPHAVAMLGQKEVRKWVTTAVTQTLGDDRPNEITKISLIRAKFAENLAPFYEMAHMSGELFLMGLFSVLDNILQVPMDEALNLVLVSDNIRNALVNGAGIFAPVLKMVTDYGNANWSAVSRQMIVQDISEDDLSEAYVEALIWYKNLIMMTDELDEEHLQENAAQPS